MKNPRSVFPNENFIYRKKSKQKSPGLRKSVNVDIEFIATIQKKGTFFNKERTSSFLLTGNVCQELEISKLLEKLEEEKISELIADINAPVSINFEVKSVGKFRLKEITDSGVNNVEIMRITDRVKRRSEGVKQKYLDIIVTYLSSDNVERQARIKGHLRKTELTDTEVAIMILTKDLSFYKTKSKENTYFFHQPSICKFHITVQEANSKIDDYDEEE